VRERSLTRLTELAQKLVDSTGYEEISLSSLSSGDYSKLPELCEGLMERFADKRVSISLPSLRIDSVVKESLAQTQKVKKSSLTFAPEAGTQRLRDVINKGVTQQDLMDKLKDAFEGGWSSVKLYFMMGLPTETHEDLQGIAELSRAAVAAYYAVPKGQRAKGLRVTCSAAVFVPKPFTPFQWCAQDTMETVRQKQQELRRLLDIHGVTFHWHDPSISFLEACFASGDRRMADVLYRAWQLGCKLDGWNDQFRFNLWMQAFRDCNVDAHFYANRERGADELLPWDFIDVGVTKRYLRLEYERALKAQTTRDCRLGCNGCGIERIKGLCSLCE